MRVSWLVMTVLLAGCATLPPPLPPDVRVVAPSGAPQQRAAFSGKWQGVWDGQLDHVLVVEQITGSEAAVIYSWGDSAAWGFSRGFQRYRGTFEGDALVVKMPRPATATYRLQADGSLDASYQWQGGTSKAKMTRVKE